MKTASLIGAYETGALAGDFKLATVSASYETAEVIIDLEILQGAI